MLENKINTSSEEHKIQKEKVQIKIKKYKYTLTYNTLLCYVPQIGRSDIY